MAIEISGLPREANIESYSAVENATPLNPDSSSGGFGQITFSTQDWPRSRFLRDTDITVIDSQMGSTTGIVRDVSGDGFTAQVSADSELGKFNVRRNAEPYSGPLSGLVQYYMDLCGIFLPLDFQATDRRVDVPGFSGVVWDYIKWLMSAHQIEMALVFDKVVVRSIRQFVADTGRIVSHSYSANSQTSALAVDINYYNYRQILKGEVYPVPGEESSTPTVEAGETIEIEVPINASLRRVYQPVCLDSVGPERRDGTTGAYTVVGQDNLPIKAQQWLDSGGWLRVAVSEATSTLIIHIHGAHIEHLSPFRIAMSAGGTDYNSLHITGDGVAWEKRMVRLYTGADPAVASEDIGAEVDNPYISTATQAFNAGQHTAGDFSGSVVTITGEAVALHRGVSRRGPLRTQLRDVDYVHALEGIDTIEKFDAKYYEDSLAEFSDRWNDLFVDVFHNQVFGNVSGARVFADDGFYRIIDATVTPSSISYTATLDTTISDFDKVWESGTVEEFNEAFKEVTLKQFSTMPLRKGEVNEESGQESAA